MRKKPTIVGATGDSSGGKASASKAILANFKGQKTAMIQHDSYYKDQSRLAFEGRVSTSYDHPLAFGTDLMIEHINELIAGRSVGIPIYDYMQHTYSEKTCRQEPQDVFIVEGTLVSGDKRLRDLIDVRLFVDIDDDVRITRHIKRDMEERGRSFDSVTDQYISAVKPVYYQLIELTKRYADVIIPEGASNVVATDLINARIAIILE